MVKKISVFLFLFAALLSAGAQKTNQGKYPSLLWEITGNGLQKPSYLFGTMHVSSKMAFHLSDSFYYALKSTDAVALELNPDVWQGQMVKMDLLKQNYADYVQNAGNDYLNENSFRVTPYDDELKAALSTEPAVVNSLLYRTYKAKEDFEEDTFLDLYIYQTGRKLGKRGTGVENYYETEKIVLQAYADMAGEKKKKNMDLDMESMRDIVGKIQDAYKRGDLDLMDSLDLVIDQSAAFREKFLYLRNEIQAASMDSIMKKNSLFVGVGAAHLAGPRGVIEILRKMGYRLRPVKMADRNATQKESIDKLKVPVQFKPVQSEDGFYKVNVPGPLFKVREEYSAVTRTQFADMSNGSYYQVARVKTHGAFINQDEATVQKKIDSLLYENIPGKILKKTVIKRNGYSGYDISSKTRRGDHQRYNIFITPFEVLIFKMSGKENYVLGQEAQQFFESITLKEPVTTSTIFSPKTGGFSVRLPHQPVESLKTNGSDQINRKEWEAIDKTTGNAYLIMKKTVYNFDFLDEDSFDLQLIEESFRSPEYFERQLKRKLSVFKGYPCLDVQEKMKDSSVVTARFFIQGPHYYALAFRGKQQADAEAFLGSFSLSSYQYNKPVLFKDSFLNFSVNTVDPPLIDTGYRAALEKVATEMAGKSTYNSYWPKNRNAIFRNANSGELISVGVQKYPQYYYVTDSAVFWEKQLEKLVKDNSLAVKEKRILHKPGGVMGYELLLTDTGSSRAIKKMLLLKDNHLYELSGIIDTLQTRDYFTTDFFSSFSPSNETLGRSIFVNCVDSFLTNLFSNDSATQATAQQNVSNINFQQSDLPGIVKAIAKLSPSDKNYFDTKVKLIAEMGYIKDSTTHNVVPELLKLYNQTADTSLFQNEVIEALARHKTIIATTAFKELILQDPPIFDNTYSYQSIFSHYHDSLKLAIPLFPEILQLTALEDYKEPVIALLVSLVDSGMISRSAYESWFSKLLFDAKIALKKQRASDEKQMEKENRKSTDDEDAIYERFGDDDDEAAALDQFAILLMPFYATNTNVPRYFEKLLQSKSNKVKLNTAVLMIRHGLDVADSILYQLAARDNYRGKLFAALESIQQLNRFPMEFKQAVSLARSYLVDDKNYIKLDSIEMVGKQFAASNNKKGMVYFFKYRVKKEDDWKIGISGLQPADDSTAGSDDSLCNMTEKKLKDDKPVLAQFQEQLKKLLFGFHRSGKNFYNEENSYQRYGRTNFEN